MAKIVHIKAFKVKLTMKCDCGKEYPWAEAGNDKCPNCGTRHELVIMPKSIPPAVKMQDESIFKDVLPGGRSS